MDRNGPQCTAMDRNGPQWTAVDCNGPQWIAMGLQWTEYIQQWTAMDCCSIVLLLNNGTIKKNTSRKASDFQFGVLIHSEGIKA